MSHQTHVDRQNARKLYDFSLSIKLLSHSNWEKSLIYNEIVTQYLGHIQQSFGITLFSFVSTNILLKVCIINELS
jgi:hypothetical protein